MVFGQEILDNLGKYGAHAYLSEYSTTCLKRPLKMDKTKILMANGSLMKVESIAFRNTFDLH